MAKGNKVAGKFYMTRADGVNLFRFAVPNTKRTDKDGNEFWNKPQFKIRQDQTDTLYDEAIDVEGAPYTYTETDIPAEGEPTPIDEETEQKAEAYDYLTGRSNGNE